MHSAMLQARQVTLSFDLINLHSNHAQLTLPSGFHHESNDPPSSLSRYHCISWRPTYNRRRCPSMRRLSRPLHDRRCVPHDHLSNQQIQRSQIHYLRHDVRLLHVETCHYGTTHCMGRLPSQCQNSYCGQRLCFCRSSPTLHHQSPLRSTHSQGLSP